MFDKPYNGRTDSNLIANTPMDLIEEYFCTLLRIGEEIRKTGAAGPKELFEERKDVVMDEWKKVQKARKKGKINENEYKAKAERVAQRQAQLLQDLKEFTEARNIIGDCISFSVSREGSSARRSQLSEALTAAGASRSVSNKEARALMAVAVFGKEAGEELVYNTDFISQLLAKHASELGEDEAVAIIIEETDENGNVISTKVVGKSDNFDEVQAKAIADPDEYTTSNKTYARAMQDGMVPDDCPCPACVQRRDKYGSGPYENIPSDVEPTGVTVESGEKAMRLLRAVLDSAKKK